MAVVDTRDFSDESPITGKVIDNISPESPKPTEVAGDESVETMPPAIETKEEIEFYDLDKLAADINELTNNNYSFYRDTEYPDYVKSSHMDYYLIHTTREKKNFIYTAEQFCDKYCGAKWDGWQYYINMTNYESLFPLLGREKFSSEERYREYLRDGTFVNYTFIETSYDVENGKVLEYQLISWNLDNSFKYFEGAHDGTFLIYKVYCSPNMTILMTPRWESYKILLPSMTLGDSYSTWNYYIMPLREEFLGISNDILKRCPANKEFFRDFEFPDYYKSEMLTGYWKVYYSNMFKLNSSLSVSAKPKSNGKYALHQVNVSFTNVDEMDLWNAAIDGGINLKIEIIPDGKNTVDYWDREVARIMRPGNSIARSYQHKEVEFYNNLTVRALLYVESNVETPPIEKTFTINDFDSKQK